MACSRRDAVAALALAPLASASLSSTWAVETFEGRMPTVVPEVTTIVPTDGVPDSEPVQRADWEAAKAELLHGGFAEGYTPQNYTPSPAHTGVTSHLAGIDAALADVGGSIPVPSPTAAPDGKVIKTQGGAYVLGDDLTAHHLGSVGAADVSYSQGGTEAVTRNVEAKLREHISIADFGADPGNSAAANNTAIQAAADHCRGKWLELVVPEGSFNFNTPLDFTQIRQIKCVGVLNYQGTTGAAVTIGHDIAAQYSGADGYRIVLRVTGNFSSLSTVGVRVRQLVASHVELLMLTGFEVGLELAPERVGAAEGAVGYNKFFLYRIYGNRVGVRIAPAVGGAWVNENEFFGGSLQPHFWAGGGTSVGIEFVSGYAAENVFYATSLESFDTSVRFNTGAPGSVENNKLYNLRLESSGPPKFAGNAGGNVVTVKYPSNSPSLRAGAQYDDTAQRPNYCYHDNDGLQWMPLAQLDWRSFQLRGDATPSWYTNAAYFADSWAPSTPIDMPSGDLSLDATNGTFSIADTAKALVLIVPAHAAKVFRVVVAADALPATFSYSGLDASGAPLNQANYATPIVRSEVNWLSSQASGSLDISGANRYLHGRPFKVRPEVKLLRAGFFGPAAIRSIIVYGLQDANNAPLPVLPVGTAPALRRLTAPASDVPRYIGELAYDYTSDGTAYVAIGTAAGAWKALN